jgi:hypothetical protein
MFHGTEGLHVLFKKIPPFSLRNLNQWLVESIAHTHISGCWDKTDRIQNVRMLNETRDPISLMW